jgi:hypothetical protein
MDNSKHDINELPRTPSVRFLTDDEGNGYICREGAGSSRQKLASQCEPESKLEYGRDFGG